MQKCERCAACRGVFLWLDGQMIAIVISLVLFLPMVRLVG
jgi:hypothetical protein